MTIISPLKALPTYMQNGDHLDADEFLHAWEHMPEIKHAELLDGKVFMNSAAVHHDHARPHAIISGWLMHYEILTPGVETTTTPSMRLDSKNVPEPDAILRISQDSGGVSSWEKILLGPAELAVEISNTSTSKDVYEKREIYERCGVREYIIWRTSQREFDHFVRTEQSAGQFTRQIYREGILKSLVFPGLWLDVTAALSDDARQVIELLNQSTNTVEHTEFCKLLASRSGMS